MLTPRHLDCASIRAADDFWKGDCASAARAIVTTRHGARCRTSEGTMMANNNDTPQTSRLRINLNQESEVSYWCTWFGVTPDELRQAVEAVGTVPANVEQRLHGRNSRGRGGKA
jgi:hypothetical protein